jgi:hypothetical protein
VPRRSTDSPLIRYSWRNLTSAERAANLTKNPFHILLRSDTWRERKEALLEILEFRVDKAWPVPGCDHGVRCCRGAVLLRTASKALQSPCPTSPGHPASVTATMW